MIIAIDYDDTIKKAPSFFMSFIKLCDVSKCIPIVCTLRYVHEKDALLEMLEEREKIPVVYTGRKAKRKFLLDKCIEPEVWIDGNVDSIIKDCV